MSDEYVPPSEWDDATIAEKLDTAIKAMLEPASNEELPQYRATIRIMRKAQMRLRALASSPSQPWISVKERLPEIGQDVLVHASGRVKALALFIRHEGVVPVVGRPRETDWWWDLAYPGKGNMHLAEAVSHWMPLPAAPALGEGER